MYRQAILALAAMFALAFSAFAQEGPTAKTAGDVSVTTGNLKTMLTPMQLPQVEAEAAAWVGLLEAKTTEISAARLGGNENPTDLVGQQKALVERVEAVLQAMAARGGDIATYEKYVAAAQSAGTPGTLSGFTTYVMEWAVAEDGGIQFAINIGLFILTLIAFKILAGIIAGIVSKAVSRMRGTSELLRDFFVNTTRKIVFLIGLVFALSVLGLDIGPFLAAMGAAGFIIAFALQGTLSNFASGIMILIYRPYDIGEVVSVAGTMGKVDAMSLVSTTLRLPDNQTVIIPNNSIWGDVITNVTSQDTRRVDMVFGCGYGDDLQKAQKVLEEIVNAHPKVLKDPAPVIKVHELADSSVNFVVRPWSNTADYWDVFWDVTRQVKERFDAEGLNIPFPQQEVHMHQLKD
ncbi:MAG: mechanosensitive ion channel family protein [bacterium]|nr:mechanosensitive ion channel family protein [bacterium]